MRFSLSSFLLGIAIVIIVVDALNENRSYQVILERAEEASKTLQVHAELGDLDKEMISTQFKSIFNRPITTEEKENAGTKKPTFDELPDDRPLLSASRRTKLLD